MRTKQLGRVLFSASTANGFSVAPLTVGDFKHVMLAVTVTTAFTTGVLKVLGSVGDIGAIPAFGSAASKTNQIGYVATTSLIDNATVSGATGISLTALGTTLHRVNAEALTYLSAELQAITGTGEVTVTASAYGEADGD